MRFRLSFVIVLSSTAIVVGVLYIAYRLIDPIPPSHFVIAASQVGSGYESFTKEYKRILARYGVELEIRNSAGALKNLDLLRNPASGVQAALTTFGTTKDRDSDILYSLGETFDSPIFIFYRSAEPMTVFTQFRGKRLAIGMPGTALRSAMLEVLRVTGGWDTSNVLFNLDNTQAVEALIANSVDLVVISEPDIGSLERLVGADDIRLMDVAQAEAIAEAVPSLKHVVLWRGVIDLNRDLPNSNVDLLAFRSRLLVRKDLHPALQYLLLEAMQEVHSKQGPFNTLRGFPAAPPSDLSLSPTAQAYYRSGPTLWQKYTSFWLSSLLNRIAFFIIPIIVTLVPIVGFVLSFHRWLHLRRTIHSKKGGSPTQAPRRLDDEQRDRDESRSAQPGLAARTENPIRDVTESPKLAE